VRRAATALLLAAIIPGATGCAARQQFLDRVHAAKPVPRRAAATRSTPGAATGDGATLTALTALPPPDGSAASEGTVPPGMQFLYGSGEAAALSYQAYFGMANYIISMASDRAVGHDLRSVVMAPGSTLDKPIFEPCGDKPLAVVLDVDETTVLNLGFEADAANGTPYDQARWDAWERSGGADVVPVPGVVDMAKAARAENVTLIFNTNRSATNATQTAAMLDGVGLGPVVHGDTLWLQGDANSAGGGKDARRWAISKKYCVIAMAGDQLGDFSDLFNAPDQAFAVRRETVGGRYTSVLWGHGWFILPNPVYGSALKGTMSEVFPLDKRWTPPAATPVAAPDTKEK
jgi:5'-nucleotidase (lipoprotein e(P4) family)